MTCIVAVSCNGVVWMGGDSIGVDGNNAFEAVHSDKVFVRGNFIYAFAGAFRLRDIMQYGFNPPDHDPRDSDDKYMKMVYSEALMTTFEKAKFLKNKDGVSKVADSSLLIGYKGIVYRLNADMAIIRTAEWGAADGSGYLAASGSLYSTRDFIDDPQTRILMALEAAEQNVATVRGPFTVLSL